MKELFCTYMKRLFAEIKCLTKSYSFKSFKDVNVKLKGIIKSMNSVPENYSILKINLNREFIKLFKTASSQNDNCYFVYSGILNS